MNKLLLIAVALLVSSLAKSQNIQLHYDLGENRKMFTTTVEMFKPDKMGSTFFFIDLDYGTDKRGVDNGVSLAYLEIARSFKWSEMQKLEPRVEFNSGAVGAFPIENAYLVGAQYTWNNADFSKVFTLQANFKHIQDKQDASFQLTGVWGMHFMNRSLSFTGFADFWREDVDYTFDGKADAEYIFLAEPQLWWNTTEKFSFGTEIEISNNFGLNDGFMINPTLAAKWTF
ncbi:protein of unknown function [Saccharicrinis carchari]|uniref:DUF5020 domain-containing protein n=1 Tax=Saccharicrinis carchari TaxID=1168039 RepID=A0A521ADB8_SACCC|nr:DUF5020 family protein [Saccharicrinis carchari]SMO32812.1 protein of unknown function [Saccharicrinis carchari]